MADKQDKGGKPEKQPKVDQSPEALARAEKAQRGQGQGRGREGAASGGEEAARARGEASRRGFARSSTRTSARSSIEQFGYKNTMQVPRCRRSCSTWASARA